VSDRRRCDTRRRGRDAETVAARHLQGAGLTLLMRNYSCRVGELDLIMSDGATLVFVEVRYRRAGAYGGALESIDERKRLRLLRAAQHFLQHAGHRGDRPCRFDVVAISGALLDPAIEWIPDAFQA